VVCVYTADIESNSDSGVIDLTTVDEAAASSETGTSRAGAVDGLDRKHTRPPHPPPSAGIVSSGGSEHKTSGTGRVSRFSSTARSLITARTSDIIQRNTVTIISGDDTDEPFEEGSSGISGARDGNGKSATDSARRAISFIVPEREVAAEIASAGRPPSSEPDTKTTTSEIEDEWVGSSSTDDDFRNTHNPVCDVMPSQPPLLS
jgi:hypothetical protein